MITLPQIQPTLDTRRLLLRPFVASDEATVQRLLEDSEVTGPMVEMPHPYPPGGAARWLAGLPACWQKGEALHLAITRRERPALVGCGTLRFRLEHEKAELAYWLGKPFWGQGYAAEAGRALVDYGIGTLELNRIEVFHRTTNPASGRVIGKIGFQPEGIDRECIKARGEFVDLACYGMLKREWPGPATS